jgi:hypothetical protein
MHAVIRRCHDHQLPDKHTLSRRPHAQGKFGTTGKFKVEFTPPGLQQPQQAPPASAAEASASADKQQQQQQQRSAGDNVLTLRYKRFLFDAHAKHKLKQ